MKLLDPIQITAEKKKEKTDQHKRIVKLNIAENQAVKRFNIAVKHDKEKRALIDEEFTSYQAKIADLKGNLTKEVSSLETRKKNALKPITELRKEAEKIYSINVKEKEELVEVRESLDEEIERLSVVAEDIIDKVGSLEDKKEDINKREVAIIGVEKTLKASTDRLSQNWKKHHNVVHEVNADLSRREKEIVHGKETNKNFKQELDAEAERQKEERRAIKDGYESLARAREEILGRST